VKTIVDNQGVEKSYIGGHEGKAQRALRKKVIGGKPVIGNRFFNHGVSRSYTVGTRFLWRRAQSAELRGNPGDYNQNSQEK
jgi:hypothetical protein